MALLLWIPCTDGTDKNQGIKNFPTPSYKSFGSNTSGKLGQCCYGTGLIYHMSEEILDNNWTIAMWVKASGWSQYNDILFCKNAASSDASNFYFSIINGTQLNLGINGGSSSAGYYKYTFNNNVWYHVAATYDGTKWVLYINGVQVKTGNRTSTYLTGMNNLCIGNRSTNAAGTGFAGASNKYFNDVRVYDHALSAKEVHILSQGLVLHYPLSREGFGLDNLIINSKNKNVSHLESGNEYIAINVGQSYMDVPDGTRVTISFDIEIEYKKPYSTNYFQIYNTNNKGPKQVVGVNIGGLVFGGETVGTTIKKRVYAVTTIKDRSSSEVTVQNNFLEFYSRYNTGNVFAISNLKMELGSTPTRWTPNPADLLYSSLGLDNNIVYDTSGNKYNGITHNITYSPDTPKRDMCSELNADDLSYIMVESTDWMIDKMSDMTINFWASTDDWTEQTTLHLFSCTEGGGFNTEKGSDGYLRFPCRTYTNESGTTAYKYSNTFLKLSDLSSGFHMFTFIYNTTGQKLYIDGELYKTYNVTTYGLHFNKNTRLFIGCECTSAGKASAPYATMKVSDFRMYSTTLSADDIAALYHIPISVTNTGSLLTSGEFVEGY